MAELQQLEAALAQAQRQMRDNDQLAADEVSRLTSRDGVSRPIANLKAIIHVWYKKKKVPKFTKNLQGLKKVMVKDFS